MLYWPLHTNGRRFIDGDVSIGDILPNLLSETYALVKKGNYRKYIDGILYISFVKITPNVCLISWKFRKIAKILHNLGKWDKISKKKIAKKVQISDKFPVYKIH